jgi:hypothetical protein
MMDPLSIVSSGQGYGRAHQSSALPPNPTGQTPPAAAVETTGTPTERQAIRLPEDRVNLSGQRPDTSQQGQPSAAEKPSTSEPAAKEPKPGEPTTPDGKSVEDPQVKQVVERLKQTEVKVKAHEAAHKAAGGNLASSASYSYTQGPDGRSYITGGEVQIDMSPGKTPQETISKMQQVIRAALAPADPSGQDRAVAAQAARQMAQAQQQKLQAESPLAEDDAASPQQQTQARQAYADPAVQANGTTASGTTSDTSLQPSATSRPDAAAALSAYA